jgi:Flp pilus assembly protein TadD
MEPGWSRPHADMAILLRRAGDVAEALDHAKQALDIEPRHPINHYNYGVILDGLGRHDEARAEYLTTLEIDPDLPQAQYNLACSFAREEDIEKALEPLARALELEPAFLEDAATDPDFDLIRNDPRFKELMASQATQMPG